MSAIGYVAVLGALATLFSVLAMRDAQRLGGPGRRPRVVAVFWALVGTYMLFFTLLRLAHVLGTDWAALLFYLQTMAGASTVIALSSIMIGIMFGHQWSRLGAELAGAAAAIVVTLVFAFGLEGPRIDFWSIEFVPASAVARIMIGIVYVVVPVIMSIMVAATMHKDDDGALRKRSYMFCTSVAMMYVPNAAKYVTFVTGDTSFVMAVVMMIGTFIGWRSYHST